MESCQADNLKRLDLETYFSLRSAISKRIYRFLDKKFYRRNAIEFDLREFALERIGLSRSYAGNAGKIKEKLQGALEELEAKGFLEPLAKDVRYRREGRGWIIRLSQAANPPVPAPQILTESTEPPLLAQLVNRWVTKTKAAELVQKHPAEHIESKIEIFDWRVEKKDKQIAMNPAGWLVKSIEDDYPSPKGFTSRAERAREAEAKQAAILKANEERRRQREKEAAEKAERAAIIAYREALTPERLKQHEAEALDETSEETRKHYESTTQPSMRRLLLGSVLDGYIRTILQKQGKLPANS
jgi:hypothetical protein